MSDKYTLKLIKIADAAFKHNRYRTGKIFTAAYLHYIHLNFPGWIALRGL
jgi:hypothetical protein